MSAKSSKLSKATKLARYDIEILAVYASENSTPVSVNEALAMLKQIYSEKQANKKPHFTKAIMHILETDSGSYIIVIKSHNNKQILENFPLKSIGTPQVGQISLQSLVFLPVLNKDFKSELFVFHPNSATAQEIVIKLVKLMQYKEMINRELTASPSPPKSDVDISIQNNFNLTDPDFKRQHDGIGEYSLSSTFLNNWFAKIENMVSTTPSSFYQGSECSPSTNSVNDDLGLLQQNIREIKAFVCCLYTIAQDMNHRSGFDSRVVKLPSQSRFIEIIKKIKVSLNIASSNELVIKKPPAKDIVNQLILILKIIGDATADKRTRKPYLILGISDPYINDATVKYLIDNLIPANYDFWISLGKNYGYNEHTVTHSFGIQRSPNVELDRNHDPYHLDGYQKSPDIITKINRGTNTDMNLNRINVRNQETQYLTKYSSDYELSSDDDYTDKKIYRSYLHMNDGDRQTQHSGISLHQKNGKLLQNHDCYTDSNTAIWNDRQCRFIDAVRLRNGRLMKIIRDNTATHDDKEMAVTRNEIVELLTDYGDIFAIKNALGQIGYCPSSIAVHLTSSFE